MNPDPSGDASKPSDLKQIHDKFFKEAFSRSEVLADFIQAYLPPEFSNQLISSSLSRKQDSHIDPKFGQHYVDMLFEAQLGSQRITIVLLLEHKSYPEEYLHFQLNRYLLNYWDDQIKDKKPLHTVVPIVIYHGRTRWKQRRIREHFPKSNDLLTQFLPDFQYYVIDLTGSSADQLDLLTSNYAKLTAGLLKTIRQKQQLKQMLLHLKETIAELVEDPPGERFMQTALLYISLGANLTTIEIVAIFRKISQKTNQVVMSAYETWVQQGIREGQQETTRRHIEGLLRLNMDAETIAAAFDMPLATVQHYIDMIARKKNN